jgi:hypothetical protein
MIHFFIFSAVALGGKIAPYKYSTLISETYIPSPTQNCFATTFPAVPEILSGPFAYFDSVSSALFYCGKNSNYWLAFQAGPSAANSVLTCYRLTTAAGKVTLEWFRLGYVRLD